jgi:hypothetical protein
MPVEPIDPSKKVSDGKSDKYTPPKEKFGPSEYDKAAEKVKQDNEKAKVEAAKAEVSKIAGEQKTNAEATRQRTYTERLQDMGRLPKPSGAAGAKIELEKGMMGSNMPKPKLKAGGVVSSASKRADGIAIRGRTRA